MNHERVNVKLQICTATFPICRRMFPLLPMRLSSNLWEKGSEASKYRGHKSTCGAKDLNRHFSKECTLMVDKHVKDA